MPITQAKEIAGKWMLTAAVQMPAWEGAFYHGSVNWQAEDMVLSPASDIDIILVTNDAGDASSLQQAQ